MSRCHFCAGSSSLHDVPCHCTDHVVQGTAVTSGLRKVTDDMKTKNRADRSGHVVAATPAAKAPEKAAAPAAGAKGPPRYVICRQPSNAGLQHWVHVPVHVLALTTGCCCISMRSVGVFQHTCSHVCSSELAPCEPGWSNAFDCMLMTSSGVECEGLVPSCLCGVWCRLELEQERKWVVENYQGQQELVVTVTDPKHSVYIYNCSGSVVQVGMEQPSTLWGGGCILSTCKECMTCSDLNQWTPTTMA